MENHFSDRRLGVGWEVGMGNKAINGMSELTFVQLLSLLVSPDSLILSQCCYFDRDF